MVSNRWRFQLLAQQQAQWWSSQRKATLIGWCQTLNAEFLEVEPALTYLTLGDSRWGYDFVDPAAPPIFWSHCTVRFSVYLTVRWVNCNYWQALFTSECQYHHLAFPATFSLHHGWKFFEGTHIRRSYAHHGDCAPKVIIMASRPLPRCDNNDVMSAIFIPEIST